MRSDAAGGPRLPAVSPRALSVRVRAILVLALLVLALPAAATPAVILAALGEDGALVVFPADRPDTVRRVQPSAVGDRLIGIDTRPADGRLYGLTVANDLYRIDPGTGQATLISTLTVPFDGAARSGIDFNPQADRLRLVGVDGQNLRVHPTLGATAVDRPLAYRDGDPNAGRRPRVTAAAYTNAVAGAATTKLFVIDAERDVLVLQEPPNDGTLTTVGPLGVDFGPLGGFDIVTDAGGHDRAWAASGATVYTIDLGTGRATPAGTIGAPGLSVVSLAALHPPDGVARIWNGDSWSRRRGCGSRHARCAPLEKGLPSRSSHRTRS
jgi:hypothetical protein